MHRSDKIYLSKYALEPDPEYLDLDDFDLDCEFDSDAFYDEDFQIRTIPPSWKAPAKKPKSRVA